MRFSTLMLAGIAIMAVASPAAAQNATRTVEDYVCTFAGKCGDDSQNSEDDSIEAPETKGMSLARKSRPAAPKAAATTPTARAPAASAPARTAVRQAKSAPTARQRRPAQQLASNSTTVRKVAAGARADLRVSFLLNSAELTAEAREEAKVFAEALRRPELANKRFRIEGHTDATGQRDHNLSLSQRRAAAVADYLSRLGVQRSRFEVRGYGPDKPLDGVNASSPDNRRVEALLL
jgi:outer membrane protein OmpA-like peptidoglycan-associated protein